MEKIGTPLFLENFENLTAPFLKGGGSGGGEGVFQLYFYPRKMQGWGLKFSRCFSWSCKVILSEYIGGNNSLEGRTSWFIELGGRFLKLIVKVIYWIEKSNGFRISLQVKSVCQYCYWLYFLSWFIQFLVYPTYFCLVPRRVLRITRLGCLSFSTF